jgi:hypothetical protein
LSIDLTSEEWFEEGKVYGFTKLLSQPRTEQSIIGPDVEEYAALQQQFVRDSEELFLVMTPISPLTCGIRHSCSSTRKSLL